MSRITPGTVLAGIALFVALGGGAYAVSGPPGAGTVGKSEIVTNGVGKKEIDRSAVGRAEIRTDSIAGGKLCEEGDAGCRPITGANFDESTLQNVGSAGTVFQRFRDAEFGLPAGAGIERAVLALDVPAGHYLIHGGTTVQRVTAGNQRCFLRAGGNFDEATETIGPSDFARVDLQLAHEFTGNGGTITLTCEGATAVGGVAVTDRKIQAYRVGDINSSEAATP